MLLGGILQKPEQKLVADHIPTHDETDAVEQQEDHREEGEDRKERQRSCQTGTAATSKGVEHVGEKCEFSHADRAIQTQCRAVNASDR